MILTFFISDETFSKQRVSYRVGDLGIFNKRGRQDTKSEVEVKEKGSKGRGRKKEAKWRGRKKEGKWYRQKDRQTDRKKTDTNTYRVALLRT